MLVQFRQNGSTKSKKDNTKQLMALGGEVETVQDPEGHAAK